MLTREREARKSNSCGFVSRPLTDESKVKTMVMTKTISGRPRISSNIPRWVAGHPSKPDKSNIRTH